MVQVGVQPLSFEWLMAGFKELIPSFPDKRRGKNLQYSLEDVALGAFAVFFTQSPSFLAHQTALAQAQGQSNAQTLFGMHKIPTDNHIRQLMDEVAPQRLLPLFQRVFDGLQSDDQLQGFRAFAGQQLIALDGTQHHSSQSIHCENCNVKEHADGHKTYSHTVLTPVLVCPGQSRVIPLEPEFITPQDGHDKQDCEMAAAKRWIEQYAGRYRDRQVTLLGDDLYSRQPLCEQILAAGMYFLFVCKPQSHKTLYEYLSDLQPTGAVRTVKVARRVGKHRFLDTYRFVHDLPLRDGEGALPVDWCELTSTDAQGKVLYHNAFVSNHRITEENVVDIVKAGRTRWKIENENNNTLKNHGYHFAHNFGHGKKHLSSLLATFNILAFLMHTVLEIVDEKYRLIRARLPRKTFFQHLQALTCYMCFESFPALLLFMMRGLEIPIPDSG